MRIIKLYTRRLFRIMRCRRVHEIRAGIIRTHFDGSLAKFLDATMNCTTAAAAVWYIASAIGVSRLGHGLISAKYCSWETGTVHYEE